MPCPKRRHTRMRSRMREAANWKIFPQNSSNCPQCGNSKLPHRICNSCGFYNGELIIAKKEKNKPTEEKTKE